MGLDFKKKKDYLVCVDSDGCVIDGMTIKHLKCFGPALVEIWGLQDEEKDVLDYWNVLNLYSMTRGINRFKGLLLSLEEYARRGYLELDLQPLADWVNATKELSAGSLQRQMDTLHITDKGNILFQALAWSNLVNEKVGQLQPSEKLAFDGVEECFETLKNHSDLAVVSSANAKAVEDEWAYNDVLKYADVIMTQEQGSKADCLQLMKDAGYEADHILMVGDSPGDITCAEHTGVLYYPILVGQEPDSWKELGETVLEHFYDGTYKTRFMESRRSLYESELQKLSKNDEK